MTSTVRMGDAPGGSEQVAPSDRHSIVVGLDGSPTSWDALAWALGEAQRRRSRVVAVYVIPTVELAAGTMATAAGASDGYVAMKQAEADTAAELEAEVTAQGQRLGVPVVFERAAGDSAHELIRVSQSEGGDLIVIGRSSKKLHRLAGSLSRRLVSKVEAPTIVVVP